jgi:hypothetical protein
VASLIIYEILYFGRLETRGYFTNVPVLHRMFSSADIYRELVRAKKNLEDVIYDKDSGIRKIHISRKCSLIALKMCEIK